MDCKGGHKCQASSFYGYLTLLPLTSSLPHVINLLVPLTLDINNLTCPANLTTIFSSYNYTSYNIYTIQPYPFNSKANHVTNYYFHRRISTKVQILQHTPSRYILDTYNPSILVPILIHFLPPLLIILSFGGFGIVDRCEGMG